jgi:uncharacterized repeat protein (TIGR01451 family)
MARVAAIVATFPVAAAPAIAIASPALAGTARPPGTAAPSASPSASASPSSGDALPAAPAARTALHLRGALAQTGAAVVDCPNGATACAQGSYADVDSDSATTTSSRGKLAIPADATVKWARLYWGGATQGTDAAAAAKAGGGKVAATPPLGSIKIAMPAEAYKTVTADSGGVRQSPDGYQASADVTDLVKSGGSGTYTVGDVAASKDSAKGAYGGWTLLVAYAQPNAKPRDLTVYDGFAPGLTSVLRTATDAADAASAEPSPSGSASAKPSASASASATASSTSTSTSSTSDATVGVVTYGGDATKTVRTRNSSGSWSQASSSMSNYGTATTDVPHPAGHLRADGTPGTEADAAGAAAPFAVDAGACGCWPAVAYVQQDAAPPPESLTAPSGTPSPSASASASAGATADEKSANLAVSGVTTTPVRSDGQAAYTVTVRNNGAKTAAGTAVTSTLGSGIGYSAGPPGTTVNGQQVTTQLGDVAAGTTATVTIQVKVDVGAASGTASAGTSQVQSSSPAVVTAPPMDCPPLQAQPQPQVGATGQPGTTTAPQPPPAQQPQAGATTAAPQPPPAQPQAGATASGQAQPQAGTTAAPQPPACASGCAAGQTQTQGQGQVHTETTVTVPAPQAPVIGIPVLPSCMVCAPRTGVVSAPPEQPLPAPSVQVTTAAPVVEETPTPTVTTTVTKTAAPLPPPADTPSGTPASGPPDTPSATPSGTPSGTPSPAPTETAQVPGATPSTSGSASPSASPSPAGGTATPKPTTTPPHHVPLPPPNQVVGPGQGETATPSRSAKAAPPPAESATPTRSAKAAPPPAEQPTPGTHAAPKQEQEHRTGISADVRRMLPFTGLPLAMLAGAAGLLLIIGWLAIRAARRRHQE